jgi:hypothetical protein
VLAHPWIVLVAGLALHTALWFAVQRDLAASDPLWYASWAHDLAFRPGHLFEAHNNYPFVMRLGLTAPIAVMYRLFGVSTLVTNLPCLIAGLACVAIAYAAAPTPRGKLLAVGLAAVATPLWADGHELNPDLPCAAVMAASILCLARRDRPRGAWWVAGAMIAWFLAFQIKEVALWCAPVWVWAVVRDLRAHGGRWVVRAFGPALAIGAGLAAGYLAFCAVLWGDPLARFTGIDDAVATHEWARDGAMTTGRFARLTWEPPLLFYRMFRLALVPVLAAPWLVRGPGRIWIVALASVVLLYWFGSSSATSYLPLPILRRMALPALPFVVVVAALATDAAIDAARRRIHDRHRRLALGIACAALVVALHAVPHVGSLRRLVGPEHPERAIYEALVAEVAGTTDRVVVVCGDPRCAPITGFYFGFEPPPQLTLIDAPAFAAAPLPERARVRLIAQVNRSNGVAGEVARRAEALGLRRIVWHPEIRLYDAGDGARLHQALAAP